MRKTISSVFLVLALALCDSFGSTRLYAAESDGDGAGLSVAGSDVGQYYEADFTVCLLVTVDVCELHQNGYEYSPSNFTQGSCLPFVEYHVGRMSSSYIGRNVAEILEGPEAGQLFAGAREAFRVSPMYIGNAIISRSFPGIGPRASYFYCGGGIGRVVGGFYPAELWQGGSYPSSHLIVGSLGGGFGRFVGEVDSTPGYYNHGNDHCHRADGSNSIPINHCAKDPNEGRTLAIFMMVLATLMCIFTFFYIRWLNRKMKEMDKHL